MPQGPLERPAQPSDPARTEPSPSPLGQEAVPPGLVEEGRGSGVEEFEASEAEELDGQQPRAGAGAGRIIAIANQKGGVGKSTTAVNLGACLAESGQRILVVDLDPQGNASTGLGIDHTARVASAYEVLTQSLQLRDAVVPTSVEGLWAIPSTIDLAGAEIELVTQFNRESRLARALDGVRADFDFILLDCPPSLGLLTVNALTAADELIVPIQCEYYALEGLGQLLKNVRLVQQNVNPSLRLTGIVMTMFDGRTKLAEQVVEEVRSYFGPRVYESVIPRSIRLAEAPGFGQPITRYDPSSRGARAYQALAQELLTRPSGEGLDDEALEAISQGPPIVVSPERTAEPKEPARAPAPVRAKRTSTERVDGLDPAGGPERPAADVPPARESHVMTKARDPEPEVPVPVEPDEGPKRRRRWPFGKGEQP